MSKPSCVNIDNRLCTRNKYVSHFKLCLRNHHALAWGHLSCPVWIGWWVPGLWPQPQYHRTWYHWSQQEYSANRGPVSMAFLNFLIFTIFYVHRFRVFSSEKVHTGEGWSNRNGIVHKTKKKLSCHYFDTNVAMENFLEVLQNYCSLFCSSLSWFKYGKDDDEKMF